MTLTTDEAGCFTSLQALEEASDRLIQSLPQGDALVSEMETKEFAERITRFIKQGVESGTMLDTPADRRAAQVLIDFWIAKSFELTRETALKQRRSTQADIFLKAFDPATVENVVTQADALLAKLDSKTKLLLRRLLFRLIQLPEAGENFGSAPARREDLRKLGNAEQIDNLLDKLRAVGIVRMTHDAGMMALSYPALTRRWKWLADELKKRMSFRDLALSWVGSGRSLGALMSWWLTRRYRQYSNLNEWEQEFLNKSSNYGALKLATIILGALIVAVGSVNFHDLYRDYYAPGQVLPVTREILNDSTNADQKLRSIKWLSDNRQKIEIPGVQLAGPGRKDLSRLVAPAATFKNSTLNEVHLDGANLAGASFNNSVLANTSFNGAYLYRAVFDGAELCKQVDFSGTDVLSASFKRVRFAPNDVPIFTNTPWWQATGWGFDEIDHLSSAYPKDKIRDSERYKADSERVLMKVNNEKDPLLLAMALNEQAWTLATYGVVDEVAKSAVMNARELLKTSAHIDKKDISSLQVQLDDTLAYILMQEMDAFMQENDSPKRQQSLAKVAETLRGSAEALRNGQLFHYAIALHASQNEAEANEKLREALIEQQYEPSHELYLLNHYMTGEFKQKVMDMTGRTGRRLLPNTARCDNTEQGAARAR